MNFMHSKGLSLLIALPSLVLAFIWLAGDMAYSRQVSKVLPWYVHNQGAGVLHWYDCLFCCKYAYWMLSFQYAYLH